ncbi:hypothetical protein Tco_0582579 [Tanacetum coccineum]
MSPVEYRTILKYRLMISLFPVDAICPVCRKICLDSFGEYAVHCKELPGFKYRHVMVRDVLFEVMLGRCRRSLRKKEPPVNFLTDPSDGRSTLRPADVLWVAVSCKVTKHEKACIENQHVFIPFAFNTFGFLAPEAVKLLNRVQRVMNSLLCTFGFGVIDGVYVVGDDFFLSPFNEYGIGLSTASDGTRNEVGLVGDTSTVMEGVKPSMIDMTMKKDKLSSLEDIIVLGSFSQLSTPATTSVGNVPGKSSYANITGKSSGKKVNVVFGLYPGKVAYPVVGNYVSNTWGKYGLIRSMFSSSTKLFSFQFSSMDGLDEMLENGPWSSYARVMVELRADVELKDNIVVAMPKITRDGHYTCNVHVEYEWKPLGVRLVRFLDIFMRNVRIIQLLNGEEHTIEVSNSNPFDVLNSVDYNRSLVYSIDGLLILLLDNDGNPLVLTGIVESDSEVEVNNGRDLFYSDNDDYDPYDDDMYENHDFSEHMQSICDDLDITVCGRKKK